MQSFCKEILYKFSNIFLNNITAKPQKKTRKFLRKFYFEWKIQALQSYYCLIGAHASQIRCALRLISFFEVINMVEETFKNKFIQETEVTTFAFIQARSSLFIPNTFRTGQAAHLASVSNYVQANYHQQFLYSLAIQKWRSMKLLKN